MTPDALRSEIARLKTTQNGLGRYLRADERTVRRWVAGKVAVPHAVALLLARLKAEDL